MHSLHEAADGVGLTVECRSLRTSAAKAKSRTIDINIQGQLWLHIVIARPVRAPPLDQSLKAVDKLVQGSSASAVALEIGLITPRWAATARPK